MKYAVVVTDSRKLNLDVSIYPSIEKAEEALINKYRAYTIHFSNTKANYHAYLDSKEEDGYIHFAFIHERKESAIDSSTIQIRLGIVEE